MRALLKQRTQMQHLNHRLLYCVLRLCALTTNPTQIKI